MNIEIGFLMEDPTISRWLNLLVERILLKGCEIIFKIFVKNRFHKISYPFGLSLLRVRGDLLDVCYFF